MAQIETDTRTQPWICTAVQAAQNAVYTEKRAAGNGTKDRLKVKTEGSAESEQEALDAVGAGSASLTRRCSHYSPGLWSRPCLTSARCTRGLLSSRRTLACPPC